MREIGRKVREIQNEGHGEDRVRDLNDSINNLVREKSHWEQRILELGGPNYAMIELEGDIPNPSGRGAGYRYFGAAKKLPGVKELFEKPLTRFDMYGGKIDGGGYYGYGDEEDGILEKAEELAEQEMRSGEVEEMMKEESSEVEECQRLEEIIKEEAREVEEWLRLEEIIKEAKEVVREVMRTRARAAAHRSYGDLEGVDQAQLEMRLRVIDEWWRLEEIKKEVWKRAMGVVRAEVVDAALTTVLLEEDEEDDVCEEFAGHELLVPDEKEVEKMVLENEKMGLLLSQHYACGFFAGGAE